jgi:hypothetical protein
MGRSRHPSSPSSDAHCPLPSGNLDFVSTIRWNLRSDCCRGFQSQNGMPDLCQECTGYLRPGTRLSTPDKAFHQARRCATQGTKPSLSWGHGYNFVVHPRRMLSRKVDHWFELTMIGHCLQGCAKTRATRLCDASVSRSLNALDATNTKCSRSPDSMTHRMPSAKLP